MTGPRISPLLGRLGGEKFRDEVKQRLKELADETDDVAYASRLRLVARGERPLRTLMHDPRWIEQFQSFSDADSLTDGLTAEDRAGLNERFEDIRTAPRDVFVSPEEGKGDAAEIARLADQTHAVVSQERLSGWSYIHESDDDGEEREGDGEKP